MVAGDRFGVLGAGIPFAEGISVYEQLLTNAFGWPVVVSNTARDGIGITPETMGNVNQTQTVDVGDGSTATWSSARTSKFCATVGGLFLWPAVLQCGDSDWRERHGDG